MWLRPQSISEQNHSGGDSELQVGIYVQSPSPWTLWNLEGWGGGGGWGGGNIDIDGNNSALNRSNNNRRITDKNGACFCADVCIHVIREHLRGVRNCLAIANMCIFPSRQIAFDRFSQWVSWTPRWTARQWSCYSTLRDWRTCRLRRPHRKLSPTYSHNIIKRTTTTLKSQSIRWSWHCVRTMISVLDRRNCIRQ